MLKEKPETVIYSEHLCSLEKLAQMHKSVSISSPVSEYLISKDSNFIDYLREFVLTSTSDFLFLLLLGKETIGFSHIKTFKNEIFLNKIYIENENQGLGYGRQLLIKSLETLKKIRERERFSLDVFESNKAALGWYLKIGMTPQRKTFWYEITTSSKPHYKLKDNFIISKDKHGFFAIFHKETRIGSFINNKYIIHNPDYLGLFSKETLKNTCIKTESILDRFKDYCFKPAEISHRLSIDTKVLCKFLSE